MKFLVEMDHVKTGLPLSQDTAPSFIEGIIFPTIARAEQLLQEGRILAGGPVAGRIAIRFIADVETVQELDQLVSSLPLWTVAFAIIVTAPGAKSDFVSRFFAPKAGIPEGPVTGSAHCTLVPYWSDRLKKNRLHAYQLSQRGGELFCEHLYDGVRVSGNAVLYAAGELHLSG